MHSREGREPSSSATNPSSATCEDGSAAAATATATGEDRSSCTSADG